MNKFDVIKFVKELTDLGTRQGAMETKAANTITAFLRKNEIEFILQKFRTTIPFDKRASLIADGKEIACKSTSFVSGKIIGKRSLISSLIPSRFNLFCPNINFNPECKEVSLSNFYFAPAVAVDRDAIAKIIKAEKLDASVEVQAKEYQSTNILVGNCKNPKVIIFAHYDSLGPGATDNAAGVAVLMETVLRNPKIIKENLLVIAGNEELSYDSPTYWGHGFRIFEKKYKSILDSSNKIIIVDCVGNGKTILEQNKDFNHLVFPIQKLRLLEGKIFVMYGDLEKMTKVYHSSMDDISQINKKYLLEASQMLDRACA